jgi:hypothetical protein
MLSDFLMPQSDRFPLLIHVARELDHNASLVVKEALVGWSVNWTEPVSEPDWIANVWYPALTKVLRENSEWQAVEVHDGPRIALISE